MDIEQIINEVNEHWRDEGSIGFPRIETRSELSKSMQEQKSDMPSFDVELLWQEIDQFECYRGEVAYLISDDKYLVFEFCG